MEYRPSATLKDPSVLRELQRVAEVLNLLSSNQVREVFVEPVKPVDREIALCDGVNWNPLGDGIRQHVWYDPDVLAWRSLCECVGGGGGGMGPGFDGGAPDTIFIVGGGVDGGTP